MNGSSTELHRARVMRHSVTTSADAGSVWRAWTDARTLEQWFPDRAEADVTEGGSIVWAWDGFAVSFRYRIVALEPLQRLVMECDSPGAPGQVIEITIHSAAGRTTVNLVASGFGEGGDFDDEYEGADSGWKAVLASLGYYLENHADRDRSTFVLSRSTSFDADDAMRTLFLGEGPSRWLAAGGVIGAAAGAEFSLELRDGSRMSGRVLATSRLELPLSWHEMNGQLTLMAQPKRDGCAVHLQVSFWNPDEASVTRVRAMLEQSLDRLAALGSSPHAGNR